MKSVRHLLRSLAGKSKWKSNSERSRRSFRPNVEVLEERLTPADYTWTNGAGTGLWENPGNWAGGAIGQYPTGPGNRAVFDATRSNADVRVGTNGQALTVGAILMSNGYTGQIQLFQSVTLQGSRSDLISAGKI